MTRTLIARPLLLLMRDAAGRFTRIRTAVAKKKPARRRARRPRPVLAAVQLALF